MSNLKQRRQADRLVRIDDFPDLETIIAVACRRVRPHLHNMHLVSFDLETLLVNCYLQGVRDATETAIDKGLFRAEEEK